MHACVLLVVVAVPDADASQRLRDRLEASFAEPERHRALVELAAATGWDPQVLGSAAEEVRAVRARWGRSASWRVGGRPDELVIGLEDPSGHLDRIRVWYVVEGRRDPLRAVGQGSERRFAPPIEWPGSGRIEVHAGSSLLPDVPVLLRHVVAPAGALPGPPARPPPPPGPSTPTLRADSSWPWWLVAAGVVAAGAVGLGVWQETR